MGYDLYITRAEFWISNRGQEITPEEWLAVRASDPELIAADDNGAVGIGKYIALWRGSSEHPETWFLWNKGNVTTTNPDPATIRKMLHIAQRLQAQVQGDNAEIYTLSNLETLYKTNKENAQIQPAIVDEKSKVVGILLNSLLFGGASFYVGETRTGLIKLGLLYATNLLLFLVYNGVLKLPAIVVQTSLISWFFGIWSLCSLLFIVWDGYATVDQHNQRQRDARHEHSGLS